MSSVNAAGAETNSSKSTQTFLTALVLNGAVALVEVAVFMLLRNRFRKIYSPRTYLVSLAKRVNPLPHGAFSWLPAIIKADAKQIIAKNGLDAYVFVRFLFLMIELFVPFTLLTWIVLLPVYAINSQGTNTGIERLTFGNVGYSQQSRYAANIIVVWILTFYVFYLIKRELAAFIILRQDFLISREHSRLAQSKTVLVTGVAKEYLNVESLTKFCHFLPGGVKRVWIARHLKELPDVFDRRNAACSKLESAETGLMKSAAKVIAKNVKKAGATAPNPEDVDKDPSYLQNYVNGKDRPHHKLGFLGLFGKKVDSIEWATEEINTTNNQLLEARSVLNGSDANDTYPAESAAFIQFNSQIAAHMFAQCLAHHGPLRMSARYIEVDQEDVIWSNLNIAPYQAKIRYALSWAMTIGLIVLWSIPVAFVGLLSNVSALCISASWLSWLCKLPVPINGIIQGALPPIALAVLFILLPIILRQFAKFQGIPLNSLIELSLMTRFFLFLVIHGFLIVTLSSGLVAAIPAIAKDPSSAVSLLATKLPAASTFFLTYFITTSFGGAAGGLLQIVPLIIYYVKLYILGSTPRAVFGIKYTMGNVQWGTLFPNMGLLAVIGITYSVIAPLVAGFALIGFVFFWFVYKYLFLYVYEQPAAGETGGLFYPKAISYLFVGLYIEELCLTGLFLLAQDENKKQSAIAEGILMIILIVITIFFQMTMSSGYNPLIAYLPLSLAERMAEIQGTPGSPHTLSTHDSREDEEKKASTFPPPSRDEVDGNEELMRPIESRDHNGKSSADGMATPPGDEHLDIHAFDHPATYVEQPIVWIPVDNYGFCKHEVDAIRSANIEVSTEGAAMNEKGTVSVNRSPPGDEWDESQSL